MDWKFDDARPIWLQLSQKLTMAIIAGDYPPGSRLPSVRELAANAGVNPNTMQRALTQLETDGLATANRTAGRTVTEDTEVIETTRRKLAAIRAEEYLHAMALLGFSRAEAAATLREEENYE